MRQESYPWRCSKRWRRIGNLFMQKTTAAITVAINISPDHPAFAGHFPGQPIVPGVVLIDETLRAIEHYSGARMDRCILQSIKFTHVVCPGDALELQYIQAANDRWQFEICSGDRRIAHGVITTTPAAEHRDGD